MPIATATRTSTAPHRRMVSQPGWCGTACLVFPVEVSFFVVLTDIQCVSIYRVEKCRGAMTCTPHFFFLASHKEQWSFIFREHFSGAGSARFTSCRGCLRRVGLRGIARRVGTIAVIADQGITVARTLGMSVTIAGHDLKVGKNCFANTPGIGLINQMLNLFCDQFITLNQGLSNDHNSLTVFLEKMFDRLELRL